MCLYALPIMSGHAPDELADGVLGHLFPELDQSLSELLDKSALVLSGIGCNDT